MATLDVHVEAPAHNAYVAHQTPLYRRKDEARFVFNKTIAGHSRNGRTGYNRVGALLITWQEDDMHLRDSEVNRLESIFHDKFKFETREFQIPSSNPDTRLLRAVSDFIDEYNSPDNLIVVYYGGHGYHGTETQKFKLAAKFMPDGDGDPKVFFNDAFRNLRLPDVDVLFIIDCCYAGRAFANEGLGRRKFELIVASPPDGLVPSAKNNDSFTHNLCNVLDDLLKENKYANGFPTSELYRRIFHQPKPKMKPLMFDQSLYDYGKIWLRPQVMPQHLPVRQSVTIGLTLHMTDLPSPAKMNEFARALQYIPHVDKIDLEELRAPAEEIQEFYYVMKKTMYTKKIIHRLRQRIDARNRGQDPGHGTHMPRRLSLRTDVVSNHSQSFDYSQAQAFLRDGTKLPVNMATGKVAPRSPISDEVSPFPDPPSLKRYNLLNMLSIAWVWNLDQAKDSSPYNWPTGQLPQLQQRVRTGTRSS